MPDLMGGLAPLVSFSSSQRYPEVATRFVDGSRSRPHTGDECDDSSTSSS